MNQVIEGERLKKQPKGGGFWRRCSAGFQPGCHTAWHILLPPRKCRSFRFFIGLWRRTGSFVFKQAAARHHVSLCFLLLAELTLSVGPSLANLLSLRRVFDFGIKFKLNYILKVPVLISRNTSEILTATERTKHFWTYLSSEVFLTLVKSHQVVKVKPYYIPFLIANMKILYQLNDHYPHCQREPRSHNPWRTLIACDQLITQVQTPDSDKALLAKTHFNFIVSLQISLIQPGIYLSFWGCPRSLSPSRWQPKPPPHHFQFPPSTQLLFYSYCDYFYWPYLPLCYKTFRRHQTARIVHLIIVWMDTVIAGAPNSLSMRPASFQYSPVTVIKYHRVTKAK